MTPYTGNPAAVQAPSSGPLGLNPVIVNLPQDTDPSNATTWEQAYKVLADFATFLRKPYANSANLNQIITSYRNALLQTRSVVDHLGYNIGQIIEVDEDWLDVGKVLKNSIANGGWSGRWNYSISGAAAGRVEVVGPGDNSFLSSFYYPRTPCLKLSTGTGGITPNSESVEMPFAPTILDDDGDFVMQWPFMTDASSGINFAMGLTFISQQGVTTEWVAQDVQGVALTCRSGHANFELYTKGGVGVSHVDSTGVAKDNNPHHARLEIRGANANDNSAAHVRLFLDDSASPVVDRAILLGAPAGGTTTQLLPFFKVTATNTADHLWVGRLQMRSNTETGNVVY